VARVRIMTVHADIWCAMLSLLALPLGSCPRGAARQCRSMHNHAKPILTKNIKDTNKTARVRRYGGRGLGSPTPERRVFK
jgi:hypothetical protein